MTLPDATALSGLQNPPFEGRPFGLSLTMPTTTETESEGDLGGAAAPIDSRKLISPGFDSRSPEGAALSAPPPPRSSPVPSTERASCTASSRDDYARHVGADALLSHGAAGSSRAGRPDFAAARLDARRKKNETERGVSALGLHHTKSVSHVGLTEAGGVKPRSPRVAPLRSTLDPRAKCAAPVLEPRRCRSFPSSPTGT